MQVKPEVLFLKLKHLNSNSLHYLTYLPRKITANLSYFSINEKLTELCKKEW